MGYSTEFFGEFNVHPPLNKEEQLFINSFSDTRRTIRNEQNQGKYNISDDSENNIIDHNHSPDGQPGLWCQWVANNKGNINWDGGEKFYSSTEWIVYLIEHFFKENCFLKKLDNPLFNQYNFQAHTLNGTIYAMGEEQGDLWKIVINDNQVYTYASEFNQEAAQKLFDFYQNNSYQISIDDETYEDEDEDDYDNSSSIMNSVWNFLYEKGINDSDPIVWGLSKKYNYLPPASDLHSTPAISNLHKKLKP